MSEKLLLDQVSTSQDEADVQKMFFYKRIWHKYDHSFLVTYGISYANGSCKLLMSLAAQDLFKNYLGLEPAETQFYLTMLWMPWQLKILCGIVADSVPLCGSRKKAWLFVWGAIQGLAALTIVLVDTPQVKLVAWMCILISTAGCFMDVIVDSLMVIQARRDPKQGSQELQAFSWQIQGIFCVILGICGAYFTGYLSPKWCFGIISFFGFFVFGTAFALKKELETENDLSLGTHRNFCEEIRHNWRVVKKQFKLRLFWRTLLFFALIGITRVNSSDFLYYYKTEVAMLTQFEFALLTLVGYIFMTIGVFFYSIFLKKSETRTLLAICLVVEVISNLSNIAFTLKWYETIGVSAFTFVFFTSSTIFPLAIAFYMIPPFVLIAKISPTHVEATIFSFSASVIACCVFFTPRMMSLLWNSLVFHVDQDNLEDLYQLYILETITVAICLCYLPLIPTWAEVEEILPQLNQISTEGDGDEAITAETPLIASI